MLPTDQKQTPEAALVTAIRMQAYRDPFVTIRSESNASFATQSDQDQVITFLTDQSGAMARQGLPRSEEPSASWDAFVMMLLWSKYQSGSAVKAVRYFLDPTVRKTVDGQRSTIIRNPAPEIISGNPEMVSAFIDGLPFKMRYRSATMSFASEDVPVARFNAGDPTTRAPVLAALRLFEEVAYAGIPKRARPPMLVSTHTHLGRLELNILVGRAVGGIGDALRSHNPHPPTSGSRHGWEAFEDLVNDRFGWSDPRCPQRRRWISAPSCVEKRVAEHLRRLAAGMTSRIGLDDPRFRALALVRRAVRRHGADRDRVVDDVNRGLDAHGCRALDLLGVRAPHASRIAGGGRPGSAATANPVVRHWRWQRMATRSTRRSTRCPRISRLQRTAGIMGSAAA